MYICTHAHAEVSTNLSVRCSHARPAGDNKEHLEQTKKAKTGNQQ